MKKHGWAISSILLIAWLAAPGWAAEPASALPEVVQVTQVKAAVEARAVSLTLKATGPFDYTSYRPSENLFVVDMPGVRSGEAAGAHVLSSKLVTSYRLMQFAANNRSVLRLEFLLREPVTPTVTHEPADTLVVRFSETSDAGKPPATEGARPGRSAAAHARTATAIRNVTLETSTGPVVVVEGDGRLEYTISRAQNPPRLVLDFEGTFARVPHRRVNSGLAPVKAVRVGQYQPTVTRVVVDLERFADYKIDLGDETLKVVFGTVEQTKSAGEDPQTELKPAERAAEASVEEQPETVTMSRSSSGFLTMPVTLASLAPAAAPVSVAAHTQTQSPAQQEPTQQEPAQQPPPAPVEQAPPPPQAAPQQQPPQPPAEQPAAPAVAAPEQAPRTKYTGEPISVNLKDVELKDFFRLIHEISGLNIVVDPAVKGTLTIVLDDVPWDQAIDIVLRNNELGKELEGNVLRLATLATLKREEDTRRELALARAQAVDPVTTTRVLSYAKAPTLKETLRKFLSPRGELIADERSNTLIIRDIPTVIPVMDNLIRQLDRKSLQVEIEARVVTASRQFAREIGTQFGFATSANARTIFGGLVGPAGFASPVIRGTGLPVPPLVVSGGSGTGNQIPLNVNLPASAPTSGVTFAHSEPNLALDFIISAAESKGIGKLLSKPKVVTQNNIKATVKQGVKIPIQTTINNTISVQFIDVTLRLTVTPQITADNTVFMDIDVENTAVDPGIPRINGIPALDTQAATTQVLVNDGGTVVIGGVIVSNQQINIAQVPLIGSLPVIGHLFKRQKVETNSQELLFFITPKIVPS